MSLATLTVKDEFSRRCRLILPMLLVLSIAACSRNQDPPSPYSGAPVAKQSLDAASSPTVAPTPTITDKNRIRTIDFRNFTYNWYPRWEYSASRKQKIVLEDGLMQVNVRFGENDPRGFEFINTLYGDLNGDGKEEVVVTLAIESTGTGRAHAIFVYTLNDDSPKMLWVHETGDRAVEGLRNVYIEDRILVIEQYDPLTGNTATTFTRSYYEWSGQSFRIIKAVRVANDLEHGEPRVLLNRSGK